MFTEGVKCSTEVSNVPRSRQTFHKGCQMFHGGAKCSTQGVKCSMDVSHVPRGVSRVPRRY